MTAAYTPDETTHHATITCPADGERRTASSPNIPIQQVADNVAFARESLWWDHYLNNAGGQIELVDDGDYPLIVHLAIAAADLLEDDLLEVTASATLLDTTGGGAFTTRLLDTISTDNIGDGVWRGAIANGGYATCHMHGVAEVTAAQAAAGMDISFEVGLPGLDVSVQSPAHIFVRRLRPTP
uniref:Uncharacterized protein n=1 Tax=viral metagenome TaxID=1070528 RepID=A0A6M3ILH7_9ZZZZ